MTEPVGFEAAGPLGVLLFDTPDKTINTLDSAAVAALERLLDTLESRHDLAGLIVASAKPAAFVAGADLDELGRIESAEQASSWLRRVQQALGRFERLPFATAAAITGSALGGGLELALACTYRVVADDPRLELGLPEVQLGLCPAAGGSWRLPRRVGVRRGLEMLLGGRRLRPGEAHAAGLVDEVVPRAAVAAACRRLLAERPRPRRGGTALDRLLFGLPPARRLAVAQARRTVRRKTGQRFAAPYAILDAVAAGRPAAAEALEREAFGRLAISATSRALVGLFFATRAARRPRGAPIARPIGVLGAGLMGGGIAQVAARSGRVVRLFDSDPGAVGRALMAANAAFTAARRRRRTGAADERSASARLQPSPDLAGLRGCEVVIEAVFEDLRTKRELLARVAAEVAPDVILASNTSTLPIARLADGLPQPERVVGLHFFSPVARMPLLEIVRHPGTSPATIERALALAGALGKTPIVVADGPGFYTTRVVGALTARAVGLLGEGHSVTEIDAAGRRAGFPVGPLTLLDEVGLDVASRAARTLHEAFPQRFPEPAALERWVAEGRRGRKAQLGFYDYRGRRKRPDPQIAMHDGSPPVRAVSDLDELADQLRLALAGEAVRCLEEGVLASPADGDLGAVLGLGFPPETGGPFRWVDATGAAEIEARTERLAAVSPLFTPSALLRELAASGRRFHR